MSPSNLVRLGGLAIILGAVLFVITSLIQIYLNLNPGTYGQGLIELVVGPLAIFGDVGIGLLTLVAGPLVTLGLLGLYARRPEAMGIFGLIAFLVTFFGSALAAGIYWHYAFTVPSVAMVMNSRSFLFLEFVRPGPYEVGLILTYQLVYLGWLLFGVALLRARLYPRLVVILLIVASLLNWVLSALEGFILGPPSPGSILLYASIVLNILFNAVLAWLGFALWKGRSASEDPAREPSV